MNAGNNTKLQLNEIANTYGKFVSAICKRMISDGEMAKDAAQEVWIQVIKSFQNFKGESKLSTWIYSITYRVTLKFAMNEKLYNTRFLKTYFSGEELQFPYIEDIDNKMWVKEMCDKCLTGILHCLDNEARLIFLFRDVAQLPYDDIVQITSKDGAAVRKIVSRSRKKLRNFLSNQCVLFNPQGDCYCRLKNRVFNINLPYEYTKLRNLVSKVNLYIESEKVLPSKNYWIDII